MCNLRNDNRIEIYDELRNISESFMSVLVDVTTSELGGTLQGLQSVAEKLDQQTKITFCSSPIITELGGFFQVGSDVQLSSIVKGFRESILAGKADGTSNVAVKATPVYVKANAIVCDFGLPFMKAVNSIGQVERLQLVACGRLHSEMKSEASPCGSTQHLPPIIISFPPFSTAYEQALLILRDAGADLSKVVFNQVALNEAALALWRSLLAAFPCSVCIDTWGYGAVFSTMCPTRHEESKTHLGTVPFPSDQEILQGVLSLIEGGFTHQLILSLAIYCKIQLTMYGGYGYGYLNRVVAPALTAALLSVSSASATEVPSREEEKAAAAVVQSLMGGNMWALLNWRPAPVLVPAAVETLACHICKARFVPGNHYNKFGKDYCTSKCMAEHRKADWK